MCGLHRIVRGGASCRRHGLRVNTMEGAPRASYNEAKDGETLLQIVQLVISGVAQGCIYGLIALGFVLIYKATETVSFAQGDLMMLGAFGGLAALTLLGLPFWAAVVGAIAAMALFGVLLERIVIRPI